MAFESDLGQSGRMASVDVTYARKHVRNPDKPSRQAKVKVAVNRSS
jgi:hypothetical protein